MNLMTGLVHSVVLAGTGSRAMRVQLDDPSHPEHGRALRAQEELAVVLSAAKALYGERLVVLSGASEGLDEELAYAAFQLQIPYVLAIPSPGYGDYYWRRTSQTKRDRTPEWEELLSHAQGVEHTSTDVLGLAANALYGPSLLDPRQQLHVNFVRNERMVLLADAFVIYDGGSPGTKHGRELIKGHGLPSATLGDEAIGELLKLPPCNHCGAIGFVNRDGLCAECR